MRSLVILNGHLEDAGFLRKLDSECEFTVCADGGYKNALKADIVPDVVVGDFDSLGKVPNNVKTEVFSKFKDLTDGEIAIETAISNGADEIYITCAFGGRTDHELSNVFLLKKYKNAVISEKSVTVYPTDSEFVIRNKKGTTVSIIPLEKTAVSLEGFFYPLSNGIIEIGTTLTMSNVVTEDNAKIKSDGGTVLIFINNQ